MKTAAIWICLIGCFMQIAVGAEPRSGDRGEIMVFAAASLTDVVKDIADAFQKENGVKVKINPASSGTLARQITQGMLPDIYISASKKWMRFVDSLGYMKKGTIKEVAGNALVLIAPSDASVKPVVIDHSFDITVMLGDGRLSTGDPAHVPAGKYAKEALLHFGWEKVLEKRLLPAKDVRSALMVVEMGEVPLGIVYRTDALKSRKVTVVGTFPPEAHKPIAYMAGACSGNEMAGLFMQFLVADASVEIWRKFGFTR